VPSLFDNKDARERNIKQIASDTGEGATAAQKIRQYLEQQ
jgi:thioredoxin reductase